MRTRLLVTATAVSLTLTACGGGDGGSAQGEVADMMIDFLGEQMTAEGATPDAIDADCVRDAMNQLSDDDAEAIAEAGPEGDPAVSPEAEAIGEQLFECIDLAAIGGG